MKTLFRFLPLVIVFVVAACSEDESKEVKNETFSEELLWAHDWQFVSSTGRVVATAEDPFPVLTLTYDVIRFEENNSLGRVLSAEGTTVQWFGFWEITGNKLMLNGKESTIKSLTNTELIFITASGLTVTRKAIAK